MEKTSEVTVRILNKTFDEVVTILGDADMTDLHVHGTQDGSIVCVTGDGDVLSRVQSVGMLGEIHRYE